MSSKLGVSVKTQCSRFDRNVYVLVFRAAYPATWLRFQSRA